MPYNRVLARFPLLGCAFLASACDLLSDPQTDPTEEEWNETADDDDAPDDSLSLQWEILDEHERGESVSVSPEGVVVWTAANWEQTRVRAHDAEGVELWYAEVPDAWMGEGELAFHDVVAGETTVFAGSTSAGLLVRTFDGSGATVFDAPLIEDMQGGGIARGSDGSITVVGRQQDDIAFIRYASDGTVVFSDRYDHGASEGAHAVVVTEDGGAFIVGHSNGIAAPVVVRLDAAGEVQWAEEIAIEKETNSLDDIIVSHGLVSDGAGGVFVAANAGDTGSVIHFDAAGVATDKFTVDYFLADIARDSKERLVLAGRKFGDGLYIERRTAEGDLLGAAEADGFWALEVAVDAEGAVYVSGTTLDNEAFLRKFD